MLKSLKLRKKKVADEDIPAKEMSFLEHLEELRWHLIRSLVAICVFAIVAFAMKEFMFGTLILGPSKPDFYLPNAVQAQRDDGGFFLLRR